MPQHCLRFQCTIPAHATRTPQQALEKVTRGAAEHLRSLVPSAHNCEVKRMYEERKTKLGMVWDVLVVLLFDHRGPLPPHVGNLKQYAAIQKQLRQGRGN